MTARRAPEAVTSPVYSVRLVADLGCDVRSRREGEAHHGAIKAELEADRCSIFQFQRGILAGTERLRGISAFREVENAGYVE